MYANSLMLMMLSTCWLTENNVFYLYEIQNNFFVSFVTLSQRVVRYHQSFVIGLGKDPSSQSLLENHLLDAWKRRDSRRLSASPPPLTVW